MLQLTTDLQHVAGKTYSNLYLIACPGSSGLDGAHVTAERDKHNFRVARTLQEVASDGA